MHISAAPTDNYLLSFSYTTGIRYTANLLTTFFLHIICTNIFRITDSFKNNLFTSSKIFSVPMIQKAITCIIIIYFVIKKLDKNKTPALMFSLVFFVLCLFFLCRCVIWIITFKNVFEITSTKNPYEKKEDN